MQIDVLMSKGNFVKDFDDLAQNTELAQALSRYIAHISDDELVNRYYFALSTCNYSQISSLTFLTQTKLAFTGSFAVIT
jgi:hypothetical protein